MPKAEKRRDNYCTVIHNNFMSQNPLCMNFSFFSLISTSMPESVIKEKESIRGNITLGRGMNKSEQAPRSGKRACSQIFEGGNNFYFNFLIEADNPNSSFITN